MAYNVTLSQFEGPLDLLLHLIEKAEMDIRDVFVSEITSQYLEYVSAAEDLDMELSSEFITMAATLLYIKSRSLLPRPPKEEHDTGAEEDPELRLMRQLREYKAYKEAAAFLNSLEESAGLMYAKLPEEFVLPEDTVELIGGTVDDLRAAFFKVLNRAEDNLERSTIQEVAVDFYTVKGCMHEIREILHEKETISFFSLFENTTVKLKIIVMFMALLELIMRSEITVQQSECYGDINIAVFELDFDDDDYTEIN